MAYSPGNILKDLVSGATASFPTAQAGTISTDMAAQAGTSAAAGTPATARAGTTNATSGGGATQNLRWSAGIVIAALILLWLFGAIVFRVK